VTGLRSIRFEGHDELSFPACAQVTQAARLPLNSLTCGNAQLRMRALLQNRRERKTMSASPSRPR
jgi:site-specific recombinase XerD